MIRKNIIKSLFLLKKRKDMKYYEEFKKNYFLSLEELEELQLKKFRILFKHCKREVPFYDDMFTKLKLEVSDFNSLNDLEKIPILNKSDIKQNLSSFVPRTNKGNYIIGSTGGSTGEPLKYRMNFECYSRGVALLYRGWSHAGYDIGDKLAVIAGSSLIKDDAGTFKKIIDRILNENKFSSYGMSESDLLSYYEYLNKWKPFYIRGYASSLSYFASCIRDNEISMDFLKGVFSTAEMLSVKQRELIEESFNTIVYNQYGLNDGGVSAYEDKLAQGMAIDTERSILEVVTEEGQRIEGKTGDILATSLYNYSFPFIRYNTGDTGIVEPWIKDNKMLRNRLTNLGGRQTDYIVINDKIIGSPVLTVLMGKINSIRYQIIQQKNSLLVMIEPNNLYNKNKEEKFIRNSLFSYVGKFDLQFDYSSQFVLSSNKHKFIINDS